MNNDSVKTVLFRISTVHTDVFHEWDTAHRFPKTDPLWIERVSGREWNVYNDTYGKGDKPAEDSFAAYLGDRELPYNMCVDGVMLSTVDSVLDRLVGHIHDFKDSAKDEAAAGKTICAALDDVLDGAVQVHSLVFKDASNPNRVTTVTISGSRDFYDLTDDVKKAYGPGWYRRWYDENKKRGLVDFPFSFPVETKKRSELIAGFALADVLAEYAEKNPGIALGEWLDEEVEIA